jgi:predicted site-specific integrase-resolvase
VDNHALAEGSVSDPVDPYARITTSQAAAYAGVSPAAVTNWRRRGHLTPVDHQHGRPIYIVLDVAKAEHATRRKARR